MKKELAHKFACLASKLARQEHPEIAKGATFLELAFRPPKFKIFLITEYDNEKLVELIVRECASLANNDANSILEHFGIEN